MINTIIVGFGDSRISATMSVSVPTEKGVAMSRYIDAEVMIANALQDSERLYLESVAKHTPSINIVWCKECKHWWIDGDNMLCHIHYDPTVPEHFCSYGERQE